MTKKMFLNISYKIFSRQDYGNGLSFPSPGDFPDPGIEHASLKSLALQTGSFPRMPPGKP